MRVKNTRPDSERNHEGQMDSSIFKVRFGLDGKCDNGQKSQEDK